MFVDKQGHVRIRVANGSTGDFREGLAPIYRGRSQSNPHELTGFIDHDGEVKFSVDGNAGEFHEGLAVLSVRGGPAVSSERSCGFIDKSGQVVIKPKFAAASHFSDGLAAVRPPKPAMRGKRALWGYIDKTGSYVVQAEFNEARAFRHGKAMVHQGGKFVVFEDGP